jgi:hypothetical protein
MTAIRENSRFKLALIRGELFAGIHGGLFAGLLYGIIANYYFS